MTTDSDMSGIVEVRCSLKRSPRQRSHTGETAPVPPAIVDALELRAKLPRITHTVARAVLFEHSIANGEAADFSDLARLTAITRERVSQVMKMMWLAPDIHDDLLRLPPVRRGDFSIMVPEVTTIADEVLWEDQRILWSNLKQKKKLSEPADVG